MKTSCIHSYAQEYNQVIKVKLSDIKRMYSVDLR